ncbi:Programmed cell death protein 5 [Mycena venus]|uniref:Programmed cell death protein 5 n=1 Tax=Mycena venus TaxID=2733690 RepID=A0A8H7D8F0_9AGAR|nr:Programmed cell death protein 5 [Mycena venus]
MHLFLIIAAAFVYVLCGSAANILVVVGANDRYEFSPSNVTANVGDVIAFQFQNKNHSVVQSTFSNPCQTTTFNALDSGFFPIDRDASTFPQWQTDPVSHCHQGMVFSVNAKEDGPENFAAFQTKALALGGFTAVPSPLSSITLTAPSATDTSPISVSSGSNDSDNTLVVRAVTGGLLGLCVGAFLLYLYWASERPRKISAEGTSESGIADKGEGPPSPSTPPSQNPVQDEWTSAQLYAQQHSTPPRPRPLPALPPAGTAHPSPPDQATTSEVFLGGVLAEDLSPRGAAAQHMGIIQQEIWQLRKQAERQRRTEQSTPGGSRSPRQPDSTNAQLLDTLRVLSDQIQGLERQIQAIGQAQEGAPPQYSGRRSS